MNTGAGSHSKPPTPGRKWSGSSRAWIAASILGLALLTGWTAWLHGDRQGWHGWHATARIRIEQRSAQVPTGGYNPDLFHDLFESATNHLTDPAVGSEIARALGIPTGAFRFLGIHQYRGTSIVELQFSGRSAAEVARAAQAAVDHWCRALRVGGLPVTTERMDPVQTQTALQARWSALRQWTYRNGFSLGWP